LSVYKKAVFLPRRIGRVVECGGLENRCTAMYRGFESLILRQKKRLAKANLFLFNNLIYYMNKMFNITAILEGWSFVILLGIAVPIKYIFKIGEGVKILGPIHGFLFIAFIAMLVYKLYTEEISFKSAFIGFICSILPFGTMWYIKKYNRQDSL
jgi:integral membrane protein